MKDQLSQAFMLATSKIARDYFQLSIDGGSPIYRERVYCYELYHQMRVLWDESSEFILNGEVDKSAHPILRALKTDHVKPDFLVHTPGDMNGNHAIIEVKHKKAPLNGIKKDLESLALFREKANYERAIYLVYGYDLDIGEWVEKVSRVASTFEKLPLIELWLHTNTQEPAFKVIDIGTP
ncbi:methionyl-tRNA formyltransferase-like protein [Vibrio jasicida]|uniref:methionyl-tRNA formyltransferase-like protein n=1 Tax=Vibrio jasicida TaxID=766224 RepID=UPI000CE467D4|nr:methionyl-tRNA formyltransferase-like protein [Vibrio jasicida]